MVVHLGPFSKTKRVLDCKLVGGDRLKNTHKIRGKIVIISVNRRNNWTKRASRFMNFGKTIEDRPGVEPEGIIL
jgi:hypothetical protein